MSWQATSWADPAITQDDLTGGTPVRLTYPDGNVVIGKVSMAPSLQNFGEGTVMARIVTPHSGDTWMNVGTADVEVWATDAFKEQP